MSKKSFALYLQYFALNVYLYLLVFVFREGRDLFHLAGILGFSVAIDQGLFYLRFRKIKNPIPAMITGTALFILMTTHFVYWPYYLAAGIGIGSKYLLRDHQGHIFNPACFGLLALIFVTPELAQAKLTQWLAGPEHFILVYLLGFGVSWLVDRWVLTCSYFFMLVGLTLIYSQLGTKLDIRFLMGTVFGFSVSVFTFHMVTDPLTSPQERKHQILFGGSVAVLDFVLRRFGEPYAPFVSLAIISSVRPFFRNLSFGWTKVAKPASPLVAIFLCGLTPQKSMAANICSYPEPIKSRLVSAGSGQSCEKVDVDKIKTLSLSALKLTDLSKVRWGEFQTLTRLDLSKNQLATLPDELKKLKKIRSLDLSDNLFKVAPSVISELKSLQTLNVSYNWLEEVPQTYSKLQSLKWVSFFHNNIKSFPVAITQLSKLEYLNFSYNYAPSLPKEIGKLKALKKIVMNYNRLSSLPDSVGNWRQIRYVDFYRNNLERLPSGVKNWDKLEYVDLSENKLKALPAGVGDWKKLRLANFNKNLISSLPNSVEGWRSIESLDLGNNSLSSLPRGVRRWEKLRTLQAYYNKMSRLPEAVSGWVGLRKISMHHNFLKTLPQAVGKWTGIEEVKFYNNQIESLPAVVGNWEFLKYADFGYNQLEMFPASARSWSQVDEIHLIGNSKLRLPKGFPPKAIIY